VVRIEKVSRFEISKIIKTKSKIGLRNACLLLGEGK
jgi:hypothetical protein